MNKNTNKMKQWSVKIPKEEILLIYHQVKMRLNRIKINQTDITGALKCGNGMKLAQISSYEQTLQLHIPSRFTMIKNNKASLAEASTNGLEVNNNRLYSSENRQKEMISGFVNSTQNQSKIIQIKNPYYSLVKMLFPEVAKTPPLSINVMDTIFFNADGSTIYIYTDPNKGLTKVKARNYTELFMKRKAQLNNLFVNSQQICRKKIQIQKNNILNQQILQGIDYTALLKYKDQTFIRLKENEFKSIFVRPVQAYQKYKMVNNTNCIQLIPQAVNFEEDTLRTIQFKLDEHKSTQFFIYVIQKHSQQTSFNANPESQNIKNQIKNKSVQAYLLYIIFQIYAYISIHYHKQITHAIFQFMKVGGSIYLSNVRKLKLNECESIKSEYARQDLFEEFVELQNFNFNDLNYKSGIALSLEKMFDRQNKKICDKIHTFVQSKLDGVQNKNDVAQSNQIFKSINQKCKHNLNSLLQNDKIYAKFLKKKQIQLDGLSPLTSLSNVSRKKYQKVRVIQCDKLSAKMRSEKQIKNVKNESNKQNRYVRVRPISSKWYKQTIKGGRECFIEKY